MNIHIYYYYYYYYFYYSRFTKQFVVTVAMVTVSFHNFKSQDFKLSVSNPKSKYVAYLSVLSQITNCLSLGRKSKHEFLKTDRSSSSSSSSSIDNCINSSSSSIINIINSIIIISILVEGQTSYY